MTLHYRKLEIQDLKMQGSKIIKCKLRFSIRKMKLSDINTVLEIQNRNLKENSIALVFLREMYESEYHYVCLHNTDIIGFISCTTKENDIICNTLCVDFPYRRMGIGRNLLSCIKNQRKRIVLHVRADNLGAREFYNKEGFKIVKEDVPYYIEGEKGIQMEYINK